MVGQGNQTPGLAGLFTSFTANDPQLVVTIDREKAKAVGVGIAATSPTRCRSSWARATSTTSTSTTASYRVYVQADQQFRGQARRTCGRFYVRGPDGGDGQLDEPGRGEATTTHRRSSRTTTCSARRRSTGGAAPGYSARAQALQRWRTSRARTLPQGIDFEWSGLSREEIAAGGQAVIIFGLGLLLVYLTLAAQYESFVLPFIILLSVPLAVLGALLAQWGRGLINDVYCQIGLRHADRPVGEERHSDRRVRRAAARPRPEHRRKRRSRRRASGCGRF